MQITCTSNRTTFPLLCLDFLLPLARQALFPYFIYCNYCRRTALVAVVTATAIPAAVPLLLLLLLLLQLLPLCRLFAVEVWLKVSGNLNQEERQYFCTLARSELRLWQCCLGWFAHPGCCSDSDVPPDAEEPPPWENRVSAKACGVRGEAFLTGCYDSKGQTPTVRI